MANEKVLKAAFHEAYRESLNKGNMERLATWTAMSGLCSAA